MPDETPGDEREPERRDTGPAREPLRELTLGRSRPSPEPPGPRTGRSSTEEDDDLEALAARCRAKAGAARWAAERQRRIRERAEHPDEDAPTDPAMGEWAEKLTDAFYWACADDPSGSPDISLLDHVGGCFEAVAEALRLVQEDRERRAGLERSLPLLAEAQSALRRSLQRLQAPDDPDQLEVYERVREIAARHRIFLKRFMRADDLADPEAWPAGSPASRPCPGAGRSRSGRRCSSMASGPMSWSWARAEGPRMPGGRSSRRWRRWSATACRPATVKSVTSCCRSSTTSPPRSDLPPGFRLVLREIDRYLATRTPRSAAATAPEPTAEVREAARLLSGRSVVLIGGVRRPEAQGVLRAALGLEDLIWIETKEHQSIRASRPTIARPDVALVLLAIRWSSHAFGDVKQFCDRHGKPLVRLPGGYNPNQVAAQILSQCGERLGGDDALASSDDGAGPSWHRTSP